MTRDMRTRWCYPKYHTGTSPHCLVNTGGNVNFLGTRNLVYPEGCFSMEIRYNLSMTVMPQVALTMTPCCCFIANNDLLEDPF